MPAKVHVLPSMNSLTQMQHVTYLNIEEQSKIGPSPISVEQARLVVPHFRIKGNSPLNVFRKYSGVHSILYPIKQTTIGLVGFSILHH